MKHNLLVWTSHSCRRDVFLEELERGVLPNYSSLVERGAFFPSAVVGGHFQRTSNLSEITGRPFNSEVHPRENILNAAAQMGAAVGVVEDFIIGSGAKWLASQGAIESADEVYPRMIDRPRNMNLGLPKIEFLPDVSPDRWLYWYRERATHRLFYNFVLAFEEEGGLLVEVVNDNPAFARDQQRYSLRLQDKWLGATLRHLEQAGAIDDTVIAVFSSHGTSLEGWLPLMGRATRGNVDHTAHNFHPNVSRAFVLLAGPGVDAGRDDAWVSVMDMKPTLCRLLGLEDLGGSAYGVDLLGGDLPRDRVLADVTSREHYSLYDSSSGWLLISGTTDKEAGGEAVAGLPTTPDGLLAFQLRDDPRCEQPRTAEFMAGAARQRFEAEIQRLNLRGLSRSPAGDSQSERSV